ncbi:MAG: bestrophin [Acidobacteria bacterium]|nr:bestrophin [Acidobacteriota bacterium]
MIVHPRPRLWELFGIWRLSVISRIAPQIALVIAISIAVVAAWHHWPHSFAAFSVAPFTLLGIALSIFLGFRNNSCYDRWWEARRQLGGLIGELRSLARLTLALPGGDRSRRQRAVRRIIAWEYSLMAHLRGQSMPPEVALYAAATAPPHLRDTPEWLLAQLAADYATMLADHEFGEPIFQTLDLRLTSMSLVQVACERIRSTPTPFAYTLLLHRTAYAFCLLLPFGLVGTLDYATPLFSAIVAYAFFGLDALGDEMEEPFADWPNALPLSAMARTTEISLLEALGELNLPPPAEPVDHILR